MTTIMDANNKQTMDQLKTVLRSLIISSGNHLTIADLCREYRQSEGHALPVTRYGFGSVLELIQHMNDELVIRVKDKHRNYGEYEVFCKANANTDHIADLVANQRGQEEEEDECCVLRPIPNIFRLKTRVRDRTVSMKPFSLNLKTTTDEDKTTEICDDFDDLLVNRLIPKNIKRKAVCPLPDSSVIPNEIKVKISHLLAKYKSISLVCFPIVYQVVYGTELDINRFGSTTFEQFLHKIPELVRLDKSSDGLLITACGHTNDNYNRNQLINGNNVDLKNDSNKGESSVKRQELNRFKIILDKYPKGLTIKMFVRLYLITFREPLMASKLGYCSPIELFGSIPQVFSIDKNGSLDSSEWLLLRTTSDLENKLNTITFTSPKTTKFDNKFKKRVINVIQMTNRCSNADRGLRVKDFGDAYELAYIEPIDPKQYGYSCFNDLFKDLIKECDIDVKEKSKNDMYLIYKKKF